MALIVTFPSQYNNEAYLELRKLRGKIKGKQQRVILMTAGFPRTRHTVISEPFLAQNKTV